MIGNGVAAVVMAKWEGELDHARMQAVLNGDVTADDALSEAAMEPVRAHVRT
jgi:aerobic C4-dicarboxylate transport protein